MQVVWLNSAVGDLERLRKFIATHNPNAAQKASEKIILAAKTLETHPLLGKPVKELPMYRDLGIKFGLRGYVLRYRIFAEVLYVVHLRHYRESGFKAQT